MHGENQMKGADDHNDIIIENDNFRLVIGCDAVTKSLVYKPLNEECLTAGEEIALFSVTQERPFNNEIKLAHPNRKTVFRANNLVRDGNKLIAGFELVPYSAIIQIKMTPDYITFSLFDFKVPDKVDSPVIMDYPPVTQMRLLQLPVTNRRFFGEWLNVSHDEKTAVSVLSVSPHVQIDNEKRRGYRILCADASREIKLKGAEAALIVSSPAGLLDCIDDIENDYDLPRGVESRRSDSINVPCYWTGDAVPGNIDEHIRYAKQGGFRHMLLYYTCVFKEDGYRFLGNYEYRDEYPGKREDLGAMLEKIKNSGLVPGLHFLHTHIGLKSKYVTPRADSRLKLTMHFTLARSLSENDTVIYVEQNPQAAPMTDKCRVLRIGSELVTYSGFSAEQPWRFTGVERGAYETETGPYQKGLIFGVLDISEFGAISVYLDQDTDLQDEIADRIADAYNAGFRFVYFDGAEGVSPPFGFHVPNAQYRVYRKLNPAPLFAESAAKAHFSWHMLSGGNAFDIFPPMIFKEKIRQYPVEEAPRMKQDFTRINFGWWGYWAPDLQSDNPPPDSLRHGSTQPDMLEYGASRAAAWDCPVTLMANIEKFRAHPRTPDNLEVLRRWANAKNWLTEDHKKQLRNPDQEHILLINEAKDFELVPYEKIESAASGSGDVLAFYFERKNKNYIVYWHARGSAFLELPVSSKDISLMKELHEEAIPVTESNGSVILPVNDRQYLCSSLLMAKLVEAFVKARLISN